MDISATHTSVSIVVLHMGKDSTKLRRTQFTAAEKKELIAYKMDHPDATQVEIANHFTIKWGKSVGRSTVSDILRDSGKWLSIPTENNKSKRLRSAKHEDLENSLCLWMADVRAHNAFIDTQMLLEKAKMLGAKLNIDRFQYSNGWLHRFKYW